jgi:hypothetical protein
MDDAHIWADRYVAVWNESDPARRRQRVADLWGTSGQSLHRTLDPRGVDAITARVTQSYDKWLAQRGLRFHASGQPQGHHDVVMCNWAMGAPDGGDVVSLGLSFLLLDASGRLHSDLQFAEPPPAPMPEHMALVERYVAVWNEPEPRRRLDRVATLWADHGAHVNPDAVHVGAEAICAEATRVWAMCGALGQRFRCSGRVDGHHDAVRMDWELVSADGVTVRAAGTNLLLQADGRVQRDVQFNAPAQRAA